MGRSQDDGRSARVVRLDVNICWFGTCIHVQLFPCNIFDSASRPGNDQLWWHSLSQRLSISKSQIHTITRMARFFRASRESSSTYSSQKERYLPRSALETGGSRLL